MRNLPEDFHSDIEEDKDEDNEVKKNIFWNSKSEYEDIDSCCGKSVGYSSLLDELNNPASLIGYFFKQVGNFVTSRFSF